MEPGEGLYERAEQAKEAATRSIWPIRLLVILGIWAIAPIVYGLGWCLRVTPGHKAERFWDQWIMGNFFSHGTVFWWWFFLCSVASFVAILVTAHIDKNSTYRFHKKLPTHKHTGVGTFIIACVAALTTVLSLVQIFRVGLNDNLDWAKAYNQSTVLVVTQPNANAAPVLARVFPELHPGGGPQCTEVHTGEQPVCVKVGTLPMSEKWTPRDSSLLSAENQLGRSSAAGNNISLNPETVTFLNPWEHKPARWSGVLDGSGNGTGMGGVSEWNGTTQSSCLFQGRYAISRSFGGSGLSDLADKLEQSYPALHWSMRDVWGYCSGNQPVVVVLMVRQVYFANRTVDKPAGLVTITGDNGQAVLHYYANAKPGMLPGPVYPKSMVDTQLTATDWLAGRRAHDQFGFGFAPVYSAVQAGNVRDYLLQDEVTGHLVWYTPITYANSTSNVVIGAAVENADSVTNGSLNQLTIYLFPPGDPRRINIDNMESNVRYWFAQTEQGFLLTGGRLLEFTPLGGNFWRAYGEMNGYVKLYLDVDATGHTPPHLVNLDVANTSGIPSASSINCNHPISESQVGQCMAAWGVWLHQNAPGASSTSVQPSSPSK